MAAACRRAGPGAESTVLERVLQSVPARSAYKKAKVMFVAGIVCSCL